MHAKCKYQYTPVILLDSKFAKDYCYATYIHVLMLSLLGMALT